MKTFNFLLLLLFYALSVPHANAQKRLLQTYDAANISGIFIKSDEVFEIHLSTKKTDQISIHTRIEGETFESSLLTAKVENDLLILRTSRTPDFEPFNDKLAAHKVMSIVLEIEMPEYLDVDIFSTLASVDAKGSFGNLTINLGRGGCRLKEFRFRESAQINTLTGKIDIETYTPTQVLAQSRNGTVVIAEDLFGIPKMVLKSIHGDISVIKSL